MYKRQRLGRERIISKRLDISRNFKAFHTSAHKQVDLFYNALCSTKLIVPAVRQNRKSVLPYANSTNLICNNSLKFVLPSTQIKRLLISTVVRHLTWVIFSNLLCKQSRLTHSWSLSLKLSFTGLPLLVLLVKRSCFCGSKP